jgi:pimeloyl-ACP methyl ester carboxylesterase
MRLVRGMLVWLGLGFGAWWNAPAAADAPATLPLVECRLEHPLHLNSIPARCGTLKVPLDPEHPLKEGTIDLKVAVVPALNRRSTAPPLFLLAGGPGQSAMQVYVSLSSAFARINRNHAIVLMDQRGTGQSSLQSCEFPEDWQVPDDPIPLLRKATAECVAKLGTRTRFYTTSIAVHDLDEMRAALGYDQIDLYGGSYGTRVAELYMRKYPSHVHAVILDGVTYPQQAISAETPQDAERALNLIVARCMQTPDCAAAYPQLPDELAGLLQKYGPQKTKVTIDDPSSGLPLEIEFNRKILNVALRLLSYSSTQASLLPALIHEAAHGKLRPLAAQSVMNMRSLSDSLATGMQYTVMCSEDEPFLTSQMNRAEMAKTYQGTDMVDAMREICALWPKGPVDENLHAPLNSDIPTLLLSGEADPVTPPVDAERAAEGLTRHRHLVLKGEGHGQLNTGCMPIIAADFLDNPVPDKLDAGCLDRHTPQPFFLSMTGPAP